MIQVFDACAMIAYLRNEPGADLARQILKDNIGSCVAHAVNLCEVYYDFARSMNPTTAGAAVRDLGRAGIRTRRDMNAAFWMSVGDLKATQKVSLADCFAIQLARHLDGRVITSDHHEFDEIARRNICKVLFIR